MNSPAYLRLETSRSSRTWPARTPRPEVEAISWRRPEARADAPGDPASPPLPESAGTDGNARDDAGAKRVSVFFFFFHHSKIAAKSKTALTAMSQSAGAADENIAAVHELQPRSCATANGSRLRRYSPCVITDFSIYRTNAVIITPPRLGNNDIRATTIKKMTTPRGNDIRADARKNPPCPCRVDAVLPRLVSSRAPSRSDRRPFVRTPTRRSPSRPTDRRRRARASLPPPRPAKSPSYTTPLLLGSVGFGGTRDYYCPRTTATLLLLRLSWLPGVRFARAEQNLRKKKANKGGVSTVRALGGSPVSEALRIDALSSMINRV